MTQPQMDVTRFTNAALAQRCATETARFVQQQPNDTSFCFELFKRAIGRRDGEAFNHVYVIYQRMVLNWITNDPSFPSTAEEADYFVPWAFHTFFRALQGEKFDR